MSYDYGSGHWTGVATGYGTGRSHGWTDGWNDAVAEANPIIDRLKTRVQNAERNMATLQANNQHLQAENAQLREQLQLQQEQAQALRADYEHIFKAFLGVVAIAKPAMKVVAKQPFQERIKTLDEYGEEAIALQTNDYILANQPLIQKYLPIAKSVFDQVIEHVKQERALQAEANPQT